MIREADLTETAGSLATTNRSAKSARTKLSPDELAAQWGVARKTILGLIRSRQLPAIDISPAPLIPAHIGHGQTEADVLGQIVVEIRDGAVNARGKVTNRESPNPRAVLSMASNGHQFQASIGGDPLHKEFVPAGREIEINRRTIGGPCYACYDVVLGEISVVSLGADLTTATYIAAEADPARCALQADRGRQYTAARTPKRAMDDYCAHRRRGCPRGHRRQHRGDCSRQQLRRHQLLSVPFPGGSRSRSDEAPWLGAREKPGPSTLPTTRGRNYKENCRREEFTRVTDFPIPFSTTAAESRKGEFSMNVSEQMQEVRERRRLAARPAPMNWPTRMPAGNPLTPWKPWIRLPRPACRMIGSPSAWRTTAPAGHRATIAGEPEILRTKAEAEKVQREAKAKLEKAQGEFAAAWDPAQQAIERASGMLNNIGGARRNFREGALTRPLASAVGKSATKSWKPRPNAGGWNSAANS